MTQSDTDTTLTDSAARLRMAIVRTSRRLRQEAAGAVGELTPTSAAALATVERHGPLTPSELAEIERVKRPTATRTLRVLGEAGLVERTPDPEDGRSALVSITAADASGCAACAAARTPTWRAACATCRPSDVETLERAAEILEGILEEPRRRAREVQ